MQITIDLPEALQQTLIHQATQNQTTPENLIIQVLNQYLQPAIATADTDQLLSLIGTLDLGTTDLAENHDEYIGEALYQELHNAE
ncbi:hypothetical protein [Leptolyngbya sp. PCC 6406]|uniref:hypothetical protein n=1 Tax=Leptolyngbya sp. PCC 6406 TaxID=1173264 RepID=UPI0002AC11B6|nr:hypothetical protein [Leptolyngbya sp. PCC 6406]